MNRSERPTRCSPSRRAPGAAATLRIVVVPLLVLALLLLPACGSGKPQPETGAAPGAPMERTVLATIGGEAIHFPAFQRYLEETAGGEETQGDQEDAIKSRLLDQFLEEQLLLREAGRLKITVSDTEVEGYLREIGVSGAENETGGEGREAFREKVRQSLVYQKVKDAAVLSKVQVTAGEVEDYYRRQPELFRAPRVLVLRQILMDDRKDAERVRSEASSEPQRFEALAREHSVAPDRGQARTYAEEELPVELRDDLFALKAGEVSPVLEYAQRYLIFLLVQTIEAREQDLQEVKRRIQMDLFQKKGEQALERYLADLKKETEIRVNRAILPFDYVGEYTN